MKKKEFLMLFRLEVWNTESLLKNIFKITIHGVLFHIITLLSGIELFNII